MLSQAELVKQMYEVTLPVISQDKQIRTATFEQAFIETLVRVSGDSTVTSQLDIKLASKYVQQYRYLPLPEDKNTAKPVMLKMTQPKHLLWIQFNQGLITKLLRESDLPVWGQQRPRMLVWIAVRDGGHRYVLKRSDQSVIKDVVEKEAQRRGLPLIWPEYDEVDRGNVLFADIWGSFWEPISQASGRYNAGSVLVGRMNWLNGSWQVDWSMSLANESQNWALRSKNLQMLMANAIDTATDNVSSRYSVLENSDNAGQLVLQVNGINRIHSYAKASRYLSSLALVKNVFALRVEDNNVQFNVDMTGTQEDLQRVIALGKTLVPDTLNILPVEPPVENQKT